MQNRHFTPAKGNFVRFSSNHSFELYGTIARWTVDKAANGPGSLGAVAATLRGLARDIKTCSDTYR